MPANNSKVMSDTLLNELKAKYKVDYDKDSNALIVSISTCCRKTSHQANMPFHINSKSKPKRKICFGQTVIDLFVEFQSDEKTSNITIFDVQNAVNSLRVMYQKITKQNVINFIKSKFNGIKKI